MPGVIFLIKKKVNNGIWRGILAGNTKRRHFNIAYVSTLSPVLVRIYFESTDGESNISNCFVFHVYMSKLYTLH